MAKLFICESHIPSNLFESQGCYLCIELQLAEALEITHSYHNEDKIILFKDRELSEEKMLKWLTEMNKLSLNISLESTFSKYVDDDDTLVVNCPQLYKLEDGDKVLVIDFNYSVDTKNLNEWLKNVSKNPYKNAKFKFHLFTYRKNT